MIRLLYGQVGSQTILVIPMSATPSDLL